MASLSRPTQSEWWAREVHLLAQYYPDLKHEPRPPRCDLIATRPTMASFIERTECENPVDAFRGSIQPFSSDTTAEEVRLIIADLAEGRPVDIRLNGTIRHLGKCVGPHAPPTALLPRRLLTDVYTVEIVCRNRPGLPFVRVVSPNFWPEAFEVVFETAEDGTEVARPLVHEPFRPPHLLWRDEKALCVTFPPDRNWDHWGDGVLRDFMDQASIFLAKHAVWTEIRERLGGGEGIWIGDATPHGESSVFQWLATLDPNGSCHCGRGKLYKQCHRPRELDIAVGIIVSLIKHPEDDVTRAAVARFRPHHHRDGLLDVLRRASGKRSHT